MADLLYHYTTINSLLSIVRGRAFWASDMRHANDATETTFGREARSCCATSAARP